MSDRHVSGLRTRLTVWITATSVIGTIVLGLVAASYLEEQARVESTLPLLATLDRAMAASADGTSAAPAEGPDPASPIEPGMEIAVFRDGDRLGSAGAWIDHDLAERAIGSGTPLPPPTGVDGAALRIAFAPATDEHPALLVAGRTDGRGRVVLAARAGEPLAAAQRTIHRSMLILLPIAGIATAVAVWFVSGIAVHPLLALRRAADAIEPASVDQRIEVTDGDAPFEIQRLQTALNEALQRVDAGYRGQERFLLNVSHELKTPISVVLAEAQVRLGEPDVGAEEGRILRGIVEEMRRLGSLVESFLLLARVRHGDQPRQLQAVGLDELIADSADASAGLAESLDVRLVVVLDPSAEETGATVEGDPDLLRTMIDNLVRNAIRFTPSGGCVRIRGAVRDGMAELAVRDEGPGIPDELLPRLFDRFTQAESERRRERGTGLGLAIAAGVAELHGGTLEAENLERGCRLVARLPLRVDRPSNSEPGSAKAADGSVGEGAASGSPRPRTTEGPREPAADRTTTARG